MFSEKKRNISAEVEGAIDHVRRLWFNNKDIPVTEKQHQVSGMKWAIEKEKGLFYDKKTDTYIEQKKCGLICDEMGLGKTTVILGTIVANHSRGTKTMIVVPPALLNQWNEKIYRWIGVRPYLFHGYRAKVTKEQLESKLLENPILLTTYSMVSTRSSKKKKDKNLKKKWNCVLWDILWDRVVYDEAHHLRNAKSNKHKGAKKVKSEVTWLLTGTPIQNKNADLYSQLKIMGIYKEFEAIEKCEDKIDFISPYVKLRTKKSIGLKLPELSIETINITDYDSPQEKIILSYIHSLLNFTNVIVDKNNVENLILTYLNTDSPLPILTRARQACVYPGIIKKCLDEWHQKGIIPHNINKLVVNTNTKIRKIFEKIQEEKQKNNKVLVFCHYVEEMELLESMLKQSNLDVKVLNGKTKTKERREIPKMEPDALLVQIQSCCEGLNLQQFSSVIFTSPHWNPAVEDQAIARAHRIGQTKPVKVYRYICKLGNGSTSLDEYCMAIQDAKRELMKEFKDNSIDNIGRVQKSVDEGIKEVSVGDVPN